MKNLFINFFLVVFLLSCNAETKVIKSVSFWQQAGYTIDRFVFSSISNTDLGDSLEFTVTLYDTKNRVIPVNGLIDLDFETNTAGGSFIGVVTDISIINGVATFSSSDIDISIDLSGSGYTLSVSGQGDLIEVDGTSQSFDITEPISLSSYEFFPAIGQLGEEFGRSVAISEDGSIVVIGATYYFDGINYCGAVFVYNFDGTNWIETQIDPAVSINWQAFGQSVSISSDKSTILVGANGGNGAVFVYKWDGSNWVETKIIASDGANFDYFGTNVAQSSDGLNIVTGAFRDDDDGSESGSIYIYNYEGSPPDWVETKITASDGTAGYRFGSGVDMSADGLIVAVGSPQASDMGTGSGCVYIYRYSMGSWVESKITASDGFDYDGFGWGVSISADGNTLFVSAGGDDDIEDNSGSIYVFRWNGSTWVESKINASDPVANSYFGIVKSSPDGSSIVVGVYSDSMNGFNAGAAYLYRYDGSSWSENKLMAVDGEPGDQFGETVALTSDGQNVLIGATFSEGGGFGLDSGSAYLYPLGAKSHLTIKGSSFNYSNRCQEYLVAITDSGGAWMYSATSTLTVNLSQTHSGEFFSEDSCNPINTITSFDVSVGNFSDKFYFKGNSYDDITITVSDNESALTTNSLSLTGLVKLVADDGDSSDYLGKSVAVSSDGQTLIVGADSDDDNGSTSGSVYIYKKVSTSWIQEKLTAGDGEANDAFGNRVAISSDGLTAVVGAYHEGENGFYAGAIYVYKWDGSNWGETKVIATDGQASDYFGSSIDVSGDGTTIVVGAWGDDDNFSSAGSIYIYKLNITVWVETKITASDASSSAYFGFATAISSDGNTVVASATQDDEVATGGGALYVYKWSGSWIESKIMASDAADYDRLGNSVDVSSDGLSIVAGVPEDDDDGSTSGSAYIYEWNGSSWDEEKLTASDGSTFDNFGKSVSISEDGSKVFIGASNAGTSGQAYLYSFNVSTWDETIYAPVDGGYNDYFGYGSAISGDGNSAAVGSYYEDYQAGNAGAVYIYDL